MYVGKTLFAQVMEFVSRFWSAFNLGWKIGAAWVRDQKMNDLCTWCTVEEVVGEVADGYLSWRNIAGVPGLSMMPA